ncbi:prosaposin-like [Babylonia areolata]|uniref:prosaposin-like n=1 Tax=Babylonia areolata TaxID=304850 RepID=UPI003FCF402F
MKVLLLLSFIAIGQSALQLESRKCTYGPSYWCSHIEHARECSAVQHCLSTVWKDQLLGLTGSAESCYDVIKVLDDVRHSGVPDLLEQLAANCMKMSADKHSLCKTLVMKYEHEVLLLLQSDLPSLNVAAALGLCDSFPDSVPHPHGESEQAVQVTGDYCTDCLKFFEDVQEMLNDTEERIAEKLKEKVCTKLGFFEKLCNETVDTYTNFIITILQQQLNAQDMCFLIRFCKNVTHAEEDVAAKAKLHALECDVCHNIAKDLQNVLRDTALQNEIISELENKVCPLLPGDLGTQCKTYVSQYGPMVFQVLVAELDPTTICQSLGFCNATKREEKLTMVPLGEAVTAVRVQAPEPNDNIQLGPLCYLCEEVMERVAAMIGNNATEAEIIAAVEKVCTLMPSEEEECKALIDEYGLRIIKLLERMAPNLVCTALNLCSVDQPVHVVDPVPVKGDQECMVCETVVAYVKSFLNNPDNVKTIEEALDEVCNFVPASYKTMCVQMVNAYTPALLQILDQYDDPLKVCSEIKLCNGTKTESNKSSGGNKPLTFLPMAELKPAMPLDLCSQGPQVFCANTDSARHCKALEFCAKFYNLKVNA